MNDKAERRQETRKPGIKESKYGGRKTCSLFKTDHNSHQRSGAEERILLKNLNDVYTGDHKILTLILVCCYLTLEETPGLLYLHEWSCL